MQLPVRLDPRAAKMTRRVPYPVPWCWPRCQADSSLLGNSCHQQLRLGTTTAQHCRRELCLRWLAQEKHTLQRSFSSTHTALTSSRKYNIVSQAMIGLFVYEKYSWNKCQNKNIGAKPCGSTQLVAKCEAEIQGIQIRQGETKLSLCPRDTTFYVEHPTNL